MKDLGSIKPLVSAGAMRDIVDAGPLEELRLLLERELRSSNALSRGNAAIAIGRLDFKKSAKPLIKLLRDSEMRPRTFAAAALGKIGDKAALKELQALAKRTDNQYEYKLVMGAISKLKGGVK